jgi:hypothetical protein
MQLARASAGAFRTAVSAYSRHRSIASPLLGAGAL